MTSQGPPPAGEHPITLGLDTFGDVSDDAEGRALTHGQSIRNLVDQGVLADATGLDHFAIGEHHTDWMPISAADVILGAIASRTTRIRLGSGVTVISSDDPVRVYQRYATLDAVSNGRAELILGRGSSTESFPLFGYDLADYDVLFEEKVNLFAELRKEQPVTWKGSTRPPLDDQPVYPRSETGAIPTWIGVGGNPQSVVRAARYGFPLMLAVIGGQTARFAPLGQLFREALSRFGMPDRPVGVHSPGHVAETDEQAVEEYWPYYEKAVRAMARQRGFRPPAFEHFMHDVGPGGALYVGSPETVARKVVTTLRELDASRFDLKYGMQGLPHEALMTSIELFGNEVAPRVRKLMTQ
ncbi:LLM class flavin-dependent oxidoreductase [Streptomyces sp. NBC_01341]|uniref:LLM class flavin-dependent oxidoreductase n=1 Tax=Streptomyces sp. NBC_01341 TaxID=2903831 RepID=UPI002E12D32F|nr:LLM class flavin-dependent oxidoreductase [Streptomyces sp. NBC_01341]